MVLYKKHLAAGTWDLHHVDTNMHGEPILHQIITALGLDNDADNVSSRDLTDDFSDASTTPSSQKDNQVAEVQSIIPSWSDWSNNESTGDGGLLGWSDCSCNIGSYQSIDDFRHGFTETKSTPFSIATSNSRFDAEMLAAYELQNLEDNPFRWLQGC